MTSIIREIFSIERWIEKETVAISIVLAPIAVLILVLGATGCALSGTFNSACISSVPAIYAVLVVASFYLAFQITHYTVEFREYREKNKHLPLKKAFKISLKHTDRVKLSETIEELIEPVVQKIEQKPDETENNDGPPVKVIDTGK